MSLEDGTLGRPEASVDC